MTYCFSVKTGKKGSAYQHARYIARVGCHAERGDLVASGASNLPEWANGSASKFFLEADKHERANAAVYREQVLALPRELSDDQNVELLKSWVQLQALDKPNCWAMHKGVASIEEGDQPHGHVMVSDRRPDGFMRTPQQFFRRYNAQDPSIGGCKKDSGGKSPQLMGSELRDRREAWANHVNEALARHGHAKRIDHRSNAERGLAPPTERHLGAYGVKRKSAEELSALKRARAVPSAKKVAND